MNKYIKKCLIVYTSLALILVGMAGAAYAVTASDADQYITRSQFATDMAYLQNQLDEAEAGLMGNINRYRSTDILFSTWDTPDVQSIGTSYAYQGYFNGGNIFPKPLSQSSWWFYSRGISDNENNLVNNQYYPIYLHRLWNGNYYITNYVHYRSSNDISQSASTYRGMVKYAVPVENAPGWYIVMSTWEQVWSRINLWIALVKLDPNVPYQNAGSLENENLQLRFKKDLFRKVWPTRSLPTSSTPVTGTYTCNHYNSNLYGPWMQAQRTDISASGTTNLTFSSWLEEETGDYITTIKGLRPFYSASEMRTYHIDRGETACAMTGLMPSDNVEYTMGSITSTPDAGYSGEGSSYVSNLPSPRFIGMTTGSNIFGNDAFDIEIVDGVNGIKYWHCYKRPSKSKTLNGYLNTIAGWHYSLPIVY